MRKGFFFALFLWLITAPAPGQEVYQHISSRSIYSFLDELACKGGIELNAVVKPYSRRFIAAKLEEAVLADSLLTVRQKKELEFYLRDYNKELLPDKNFDKRFDIFYYKDSLFSFSLNPIGGIHAWSNRNGANYHRWNGVEVFAYAGKHIGVYASLRDNHEDKMLSATNYLDTRPGARYKSGQDFSEMRGGVTFSWNWGSVGLVKDHAAWGNHYHYPGILSGKAPSYPQLKIVMKPAAWFSFNYIHGWLNSGVIDSLRTYTFTNSYGHDTRIVYRKKFIAANMFTFRPLKRLHASVGNSIVYSDMEAHPAYLIPFLLYKSVDHSMNQGLTNGGGHNSQFFIDISSRQLKHLHLYATLFFDDISITRLKANGHFDYYSINTGFRLSNLVPDMFFTFEYFQSYPLVYKHNMPTTTFESNLYNLGHYLQDNSRGLYAEVMYRPLRGLDVVLHYNLARHGPDHTELGTPRLEVVHLFLSEIDWESNRMGLRVKYQVLHDIFIAGSYEWQKIAGNAEKYSAPFFHGETHTFSLGVNYGF